MTLETLDNLLEGLREELKTLQKSIYRVAGSETQQPSSSGKRPPIRDVGEQTEKKKTDYTSIDLTKARRLIKARENAIKWVKDSLNELHSSKNGGEK